MLRTATVAMYCPKVSCGVLIILGDLLSHQMYEATRHGLHLDFRLDDDDDDDGNPLKTVGPIGCPSCNSELCFQCRSEWHPGMTCNQYQYCVSKHADSITKFCRQMNWMRCYECGHVVEKKMGCNHIVCICGAQFCYLCGAKWGTCKCQVIGAGHALRHNRTHNPDSLHRCPDCGQPYPSEEELRVHRQHCSARHGLMCNSCNQRFADLPTYRSHRRQCLARAHGASTP